MRINIKGHLKPYTVEIEEGSLARVPTEESEDSILITDRGVPDEHIEAFLHGADIDKIVTVQSGERSKSIRTFERIVRDLQTSNISRNAHIYALGGGVVGDLSGFVASTYKRGIKLTLLPTTLVAMVDAAIGGKFAVNTIHAKNSVGSFYNPERVIVDPSVLNTLPERHLRNGMAEIIKIALIADAGLFERIYEKPPGYRNVSLIQRAIELKKQFVEADPYDRKDRRILNFGHTFGHAIEQANDYAYLHGECVAEGMRLMAMDKPYYDKLKVILDTYGFDTPLPCDKNSIEDFIKEDKKAGKDDLRLIEVYRPGDTEVRDVPLSRALEILERAESCS